MASLPYIQLYPADYLSDTQHLDTLEHGAYFLMIMNYWQTGKPLPDNDKRLAIITKMSVDDWLEIRPTLEEFFDIKEGCWYHYRIEADLDKVNQKSKQASNAGKESAKRRIREKLKQKKLELADVESENNVDSTSVPTDVPTDVSTESQRKGNHTDTDTETDTDKDTDKNKYIGTLEFDLFSKIREILVLPDLPFTETRFRMLQKLRTHNQIRDSGCLKAAENYQQDEFYAAQGYDWLFNNPKSVDRVTEWAAKPVSRSTEKNRRHSTGEQRAGPVSSKIEEKVQAYMERHNARKGS